MLPWCQNIKLSDKCTFHLIMFSVLFHNSYTNEKDDTHNSICHTAMYSTDIWLWMHFQLQPKSVFLNVSFHTWHGGTFFIPVL